MHVTKKRNKKKSPEENKIKCEMRAAFWAKRKRNEILGPVYLFFKVPCSSHAPSGGPYQSPTWASPKYI